MTFSIVINTMDRADSLEVLLQALEGQTYPNFEVIVVVGPVRDHTLEVLNRYEGRVQILHCDQANLARSRNIGLLAARGDVVAFIDDDAVPCRRWLESLASLFENPLVDGTGGMVYLAHPAQPTIQFRFGIMSSLGEQLDVCSSWLEHLVPPPGTGRQWFARVMGCNMAFRRRALLEVGGFDEFYQYVAEEADLVFRMVHAGKTVFPVREAPVYHFPASSRYRKSFTNIGKWWIQTRSMVYFAIKNGLQAGDSPSSVARRCLHLVHGHLLWYTQLLKNKEWSLFQYIQGCLGEILALGSGVLNGVLMPRILLRPSVWKASGSSRPILRFQNEHSAFHPFPDPVSARCPRIQLTDPPLQICLLSGSYPPIRSGGIGRYTQMLARGLQELGHRVHVVTRGDEERVVVQDGVFVCTVPYRLSRYHQYRWFYNAHHILNYSHAVYEQVKRLVLNEGIEVVCSPLWQAEGLVTAVSGLLPVVVWLQTTLQQIAELQGSWNRDMQIESMLEQILLERSTFLVPISSAIRDVVRRNSEKALSTPSRVIPPGIVPVPENETRPFDPERKDGPFTVLFVGRLEKRKGILDLFHAISLVVERVPHDIKFVIAGADNSVHDGFQKEMGMSYPAFFTQNYSKYTPYVDFLGEVTDEQLEDLYQACDIFVAPSLYESFGIVYLEAMNYAKPVVGCWTGGVPEVVENGHTGLLVEPGAPSALAGAILSLLNSPQRMREMGLAGRQRLLDRFTYIEMARAFEEVFRETIRLFEASREDQR
ncbi:MAG: glycosyltransferase [Ardenticatenia bacterium]|nr:glycosyltransferase [Ardenticatenia bacterium]